MWQKIIHFEVIKMKNFRKVTKLKKKENKIGQKFGKNRKNKTRYLLQIFKLIGSN